METELLCLTDAYQKECDAKVLAAEGDFVILDRSVFFPTGGGAPCDTGKIACGGKSADVVEVSKKDGRIFHKVSTAVFSAGDSVRCTLDWEKRHRIMRMHTCSHVLGAIMFAKGAQVTGNQLGTTITRFDFDCPTGTEKAAFEDAVAELNGKLSHDTPVRTYSLPREEAFKIPGVVKLADKLPPSVASLRIVEIAGIDTQACGGMHVRNLSEVGRAKIEKIENKGASKKRLYFSLSP
ncbi:MAG: alanyl-tRNA editing protein [Candidatus Micrarchaeia archaeon]